jgi:predicted SnoaL-like aldol condensation-catalyzing enzyme
MNSIHPNITILQQFDPGNVYESANLISEDAVLHYYNSKLPNMQGDYHGRQGFIEFFRKIAGQTQGSFEVTPKTITPMGDELVVTHVVNSMTLNARQIEIDAVVVWRIVDGKIQEAWDIPAIYAAKIQNENHESN